MKQLQEMEMPHNRNEGPAPEEYADAEALAAENASLRDRILRALADAENRRRRAERAVQVTSKYAIVVEVDDGSYPPGWVARALEDGYMIHDRLLRAARVAVAKRRSNESPSPDEATPPAPSQSRSSRHAN